MSGSLNKVILIGNLGADPEMRQTQQGASVVSLRLATNETWNDREGQRQKRTEWHSVVVFGRLADVCGKYLRRGSKVLVEGQLRTRKWQDSTGADRYSTEVVLSGYGSNMQMLDSGGAGERDHVSSGIPGESSPFDRDSGAAGPGAGDLGATAPAADFDDDIPF